MFVTPPAVDQLLALGIEQIQDHAHKLAAILIDGAARLGWYPYRPPGGRGACSHIISLSTAGGVTQTALTELGRQRIVCGTRGGRIRVSLAPFNNEQDVDAFLAAIASVRQG